ncbi:hypothetical protein [Nitrosopumilus sp. b1]|uniref:hypothetical protein n=1 Tax=Nitrosopumilus sp. b1 TaxID=2109907 RepID=UPI002107DA3F|nr:hypothetical protein [Nitrosopumilus sp. b1]
MSEIAVYRHTLVIVFSILLFMPVYANAQTSKISLLDNFGDFQKGESLFIFGNIALIDPESFLILQIINPNGDICQIQQISPLPSGAFVTDSIPLKGSICGLSGDYTVKLFYGEEISTASFRVLTTVYKEPSSQEYFDNAKNLISEKIVSLNEKTNVNTLVYSERLNAVSFGTSSLQELEVLYADLWVDFFIEDELFEIDPKFRPVITSSLDATSSLIESSKLSFDLAKNIDKDTFSALFYYEIGDANTAIEKIKDVFVSIQNVDPVKITPTKIRTFEELEETLLNLMKKTGSIMNRNVKEEIAFIFARGTAPVYATELNDLLDLLSESRYLDVISRKDNSLYRLVNSNWENTRESLLGKETIEELLESRERVGKLYSASLLLRDLENVDRFITSDVDNNSELANLIMPSWDDLQSRLELASSVDDILDSRTDIEDMKNVIDISSRISKAVEISNESQIDSAMTAGWKSLLEEVQNASSVDEILVIVSEFDSSINELREKRNPLNILKFQYETMRTKAELQADTKNLYLIDNALKILDTAQKLEDGNPTVSKIDRIEVLLAWVSAKAPEIKNELDSYSKDAYKVRASDILQRAKSIENLVDLSLRKNRFLPGYTDFTDSMNERIDVARNLIIKNDLDAADNMVRELFEEWRQVSEAYADDPFGSDVGYSKDELRRIEFREKLDSYSQVVANFYNADFDKRSSEYNKMTDDAYDLLEHGNFVDAETKINEIGNYLSEYLALNNDKIIYDISYDPEQDIWVMSGFVDKPIFDRRENLYLTVYEMDGTTHSNLKFTDTKEGVFFTQWEAPVEPGLYVVMLQYQNQKASQIVNVAEKVDRKYSSQDLDMVELAREFEELQSFVERFGGDNYATNNQRFASVINDIELALKEKNPEKTSDKLSELNRLIERYLPSRSRSAVIEVQYEDNKLLLSGAVQKTLSFSEDLFVDIFNQRGERVYEVGLKDTSSGHFNEVLSKPFSSGTYVAQLEYHDLFVNDFFVIP